jgi:hypothetical protein
MIRPLVSIHLDRMAAPVIGAIRQQAVNAGLAHLNKGDLRRAGSSVRASKLPEAASTG